MRLFGKSKRVRMGEAYRATCRPLLYELGFRNPRRHDRDRWNGSRLDVFLRWRGVDYDEVRIYWWTLNRPRFRIHLMASTYERDAEGRPTRFRWVIQASASSWVLRRRGSPG
jgi:hypothetical protein